ncbi:DNA topoisomerase-3 [Ruminiclostridium sufflavum DSM 19573]|uniref:DNA topoisomerase n=1 Tax=Ruminiclostridium sufflavum DSM 19573 TaxID=1121337 RepID=A0A318XKY1_9FIRM|nr:DNA topoisomerase 3 [Ruminiclostridium sufflavum]PYG87118.1 DNA topoisomerase-3 [Ruminiclostridium sufflavum DSM 19573]
MGKRLFITEKPSVAASFAGILGLQIAKNDRGKGFAENNEIIVSWCFGHLVTMAYPDAYDSKYKEWKIEQLPIIPSEYKYTVIDERGIGKQFNVIKTLMCREDVEMIYACTDSGREGEYIFRLVYAQSGCNKPAKRVWISSQTEESIKRGIDEAKSINAYDLLAKAAYSRAKEDWLFGMNLSRMYTCQYGRILSNSLKESKSSVIPIGRVMTCVLGLVVDRELEIRNFVPQKHYGIKASFKSQDTGIEYAGRWQPKKSKGRKASEEEEQDKYIGREEAEETIERLTGKEAVIKKVEVKVKNEQPPLLFNLAELQSEANKKFKLPVEKTLEIAQSLYEKKLISYPRTDSRVLSTDVVGEIPKVLNGLYKNEEFKDYILRIKEQGELKVTKTTKRYVDNSKVTDHYAIIPTYVTARLSGMDTNAAKIYSLIVKRFLAVFYPAAQYNTVKVETNIDGETFVSNAKTLLSLGWKEVYEVSAKKDEEEITDSPIHKLVKNEKSEVLGFELEEKETKPPSRYTDGSLIITMEKAGKFIENEELREQIKTCGIGTSATRAGIIKKLREIGHISIHSKTQVVTPTLKGEAIVKLVRRTAKELLNPSLTASWEKGLSMIENGETTEAIFMEKLHGYITRSIEKVKNIRDNRNILNL